MKLYTVFIERNISKINCQLGERAVDYSTLFLSLTLIRQANVKQLKPQIYEQTEQKKILNEKSKHKMCDHTQRDEGSV